MNFNNVNACAHALEQKSFFEKLAISQKLQEISKCCQKDFCSEWKIKNILLKAQMHILMISRTVYKRVNFVNAHFFLIFQPCGKDACPTLTSLFIPSPLSRKLSGAFVQNKSNCVSADFLSNIPNLTILHILYFLCINKG